MPAGEGKSDRTTPKPDPRVTAPLPAHLVPTPAPPRPAPPRTHRDPGLDERLFSHGYEFEFAQAVRLLEMLADGPAGPPPVEEALRVKAHLSMAFPPSAVHAVEPPTADRPQPAVTVSFLGMTGPCGALPLHYTHLLMRLAREGHGTERTALRDWLDLFNHRAVSLFFRAWEKYRFPVPYFREARRPHRADAPGRTREPDAFTGSLLALVGLGVPGLRRRLRVEAPPDDESAGGKRLAEVDDLALLHYAGLFAQKPHNAAGLEAILADYFGQAARVVQFTGQWLVLEPASRSRLADDGGNCELGVNAVAGERVWDVVSKFRVRLGPLCYADFAEFLPDPAPVALRKGFFLLSQLVRLYAGMELDFEVQLALRGDEVPACELREADDGELGARLGWNTWLPAARMPESVDDAVFDGIDAVTVS
jgi:type VI secretion system protein ImpH